MKFIFSICVIFATVGTFSFAEVVRETTKSKEPCPEKLTTAQCKDHVKAELMKEKSCMAAAVYDNIIEWESCKHCSQVPGASRIIPAEDGNKPFPDCCPSCQLKSYNELPNFYLTMQNVTGH